MEQVSQIGYCLSPYIEDGMTVCLEGVPSSSLMEGLIILQNVGSCIIRSTVDSTIVHIDTCLLDEVLLFVLCQLVPIPPRNDIIELVCCTLVVNLNTIGANLLCLFVIAIVSIAVRLDIQQLQLTIRAGCDGQRNLHLLRVGGS